LTCPLGSLYFDYGGVDSVSGTTTQLPASAQGTPGQVAVYKYVLYYSATNPAVVAGPGPVYYTDETGLVVSGKQADGFIAQTTAASLSDVAGFMMVNTTDLTTLTATLLNNSTSGSGIWMCIGGFCKKTICASTTTAGDFLYGGTTAFTSTRIAAHTGTVPPDRLLGIALSSAAQIGATGVYTCDAIVTVTGLGPY